MRSGCSGRKRRWPLSSSQWWDDDVAGAGLEWVCDGDRAATGRTVAPADRGVKTVAVQFGTAGTQTLSVRDAATPSIASSVSTQVLHGPAAALVLAAIPPSIVAGTGVAAIVTAVDSHGNVVTDFTGTSFKSNWFEP